MNFMESQTFNKIFGLFTLYIYIWHTIWKMHFLVNIFIPNKYVQACFLQIFFC